MSTENTGIQVKQPTPTLLKEVKVDFKKLLPTLAKSGVDAFTGFFTGNWSGLAKDAVDLSTAFGLAKSTEEKAGLLIINSLSNAIEELINSNLSLFPNEIEKRNSKQLQQNLSNALENYNSLTINQDFFEHPENLPFLKDVKASFLNWLKTVIANPNQAESISNRLSEYFASALFQEWKNNQSQYQVILDELDNPFAKAQEKQRQWYYYRASLQKQIQEPVFDEAFSLKEIYINLRAYYESSSKENTDVDDIVNNEKYNRKTQRIVVNPTTELDKWLDKADKNDPIRMITGAPGSGKSSFGKIWAAQQAEKGKNVLFIPLHRFTVTGDLINSVGEFLTYGDIFTHNPMEKENQELSLIVIFDGLDELAKQGKIGEQTAKDFVDEIRILVNNFNQNKTRLQVLILGREVVIQANSNKFKHTDKLIYLLPYFLTDKEKRKYKYIDKENLLEKDQRQLWWQKYAKAKGKDYTGLPSALNRDNLIDITSQPLLNYLVVLSYERNNIQFDENTNINQIYADLLTAVYERGYEGENRQHQAIEGISEREFKRILMEIALTCWHGNGRTTTIKEIQIRCESGNLKQLLQKFEKSLQGSEEEKSKASISNLLLAFYFRESGDLQGSDKTFEFSHKSFGEYLTAIRLVQGLKMIDDELTRSEENYGTYDEKQALIDWANLCGASPLDFDTFPFICREMRLQKPTDVEAWQKRLCKLIEYLMVKAMPIEALNLPSFQMMIEYSKNAESALLIVLNACARVINAKKIKQLSVIDWKSSENFGEWISRLIGQRKDFELLLITDCLSYLDLKECDLRLRDFFGAILEEAILERANLVRANLVRAILEGANLGRANLGRANLEEAILVGAILVRAILVGAILVGANLEGAILEEANLVRANLERANLGRANLGRANLVGANLEEANLEGANLGRANLVGANLVGANLEEANLEGANLGRANLKNTILEGKDIKEITEN